MRHTMNVVEETNHESRVEAEVSYTSYKWYLTHWSQLADYYYAKGIWSPRFNVTGSEGCTCRLYFSQTRALPEREIQIQFDFRGTIEFYTMQIALSFLDENMQKLRTRETVVDHGEGPTLHLPKITIPSHPSYLRNNTMIFLFELSVIKSIAQSPISTDSFNPNLSEVTYQQINHLYQRKDLYDVVFTFEDTERTLSAHKLILAANSEVFRAMFMNDMREKRDGTVNIVDIEYDLFEIFLGYMYTAKISKLGDVVNELTRVADKYQVISLKDICEKYMARNLNDVNVVKHLLTAHRYCCNTLERKAIEYIRRNRHILKITANHIFFKEYPMRSLWLNSFPLSNVKT